MLDEVRQADALLVLMRFCTLDAMHQLMVRLAPRSSAEGLEVYEKIYSLWLCCFLPADRHCGGRRACPHQQFAPAADQHCAERPERNADADRAAGAGGDTCSRDRDGRSEHRPSG